MRKHLFIFALLSVFFVTASNAQTGDVRRFEAYVGYSNNQVEINSGDRNNVGIENFFDGRESFNGVELAAFQRVRHFDRQFRHARKRAGFPGSVGSLQHSGRRAGQR